MKNRNKQVDLNGSLQMEKLYETTKRNLAIARKRNFKCMLCRQSPPTVEYAFKKSGYYCFVCSVVINLITIAFVIIVGFILLSHAILN